MDAAAAPRDSRPLIAGEAARISLRVRGGEPPYRIELTAATRGRAGKRAPPLLSAELEAAPSEDTAAGVEIAVQAELAAGAWSGAYQVLATAEDRRGARAEGRSEEIQVVGEGAEVLPAPDGPPRLEILDAGGRRRPRFHRGELVTLRGAFESAETALVAIQLPERLKARIALSRTEVPLEGDRLAMTFQVPRLARPGVYRVRVAPANGPVAITDLEVTGPAFAPARRLTIDRLSLYGGADLRAPRGGMLRRGERLRVEARVGGGRRRVAATLRLRDRAANVALEVKLDGAPIRDPAPDARVFVTGEVEIPAALVPGRHMLEIEAREGDDVTALHRDVLVR